MERVFERILSEKIALAGDFSQGGKLMVLFFISMMAAAISFGILYTYLVRMPVLFMTRVFTKQINGDESKEMEGVFPEKAQKVIWYPLKIVFFLGETYIQAGWGAYCVLRALRVINERGLTQGWGVHIAAFLACLSALGYLAHKEPRKDIAVMIQSSIAMGSYMVYCLVPTALEQYYPWLVSYFHF